MFFIAILILLIIAASAITTIPLSVALLAVTAVLLKKSRVFFLAFGLGLFADLISLRPLGYASLLLIIFVFLIRLYERKFETQTMPFVFISTFLGSISYLWLFGYNNILVQSLICAVISILLFKFLNIWI